MLASFFMTLVLAAHAEVLYLRTGYNVKEGSAEQKILKKCGEIPYSYVAELEGFRRTAREIQTLLHGPDYFSRAGEVAAMREQLNIHSERLNQLARPDWNAENHALYLSWIVAAPENGRFTEQSVERVMLMGKSRPDLKPPPWAALFSDRPGDLTVRISKNATLLEICQLIRTIEVDYTVKYFTQPLKPVSDVRLYFEQKFKLVFEEI